MTTISYPSFPPIDQLVGRLRTADYRRLALSIWSAIVTACVYTYIAGQLTRRAVNFLLPHVITALKACATFLETLVDSQPSPSVFEPATVTPKPQKRTSSRKKTNAQPNA